MVSKRFLTVVHGPGAIGAAVGLMLLLCWAPAGAGGNSYNQINLLSDNSVPGTKPDARLLNAWGMAFFSGGPFWINDEGSAVSELIDGKGNMFAALPFVTIPAPPGAANPARPTGIVTNGTSKFVLPGGNPALFIFDTLDGTIAAWNSGTAAVVVVDNSTTARYTGLAMATIGGNPFLYAANSVGGIDAFDGNFKPFKTTGGFVDPHVPSGLTPFGIANIDGNLFVTYAQPFGVSGVVDEFSPQGSLIRRFATGGTLNQPWAVVMAPPNFGTFGNDLLIGNFGNGTINAFNSTTGTFLGQLHNAKGIAIAISGLWALTVGADAAGVTNPNAMYFTAGPNGQTDGLFGFIVANGPAPTPTPTKRPTSTPTRRPTPTPTKQTTITPTGTPTPKPSVPVIVSVPPTILVGDSFPIDGTGFSAGSVVNFFVATATGPVNFGPFNPAAPISSTKLAVPVPLVSRHGLPVTLGQGVVAIEVVNTDEGFAVSNLATAQLFGDNRDGFSNLTGINSVGLAATSTNPSFATDNVATVVKQNTKVTLNGNGFDTVHGVAVDLFCACPGRKVGPFFLNPGNPGLTSSRISFTLPAGATTGPGSFVVSDKGPKGDYAIKSNAVSVPIGSAIAVTSVSQSGKIITVNGAGFSTLTAINFFNTQSGAVVNLGGLGASGAAKIPLTFVNENKFAFTVPAGAMPGPCYVQALNPPFVPFTSSGNQPGGAFTLTALGATPTRRPTPTATKQPTPTETRTPKPTFTPFEAPTPTPTPYFYPY